MEIIGNGIYQCSNCKTSLILASQLNQFRVHPKNVNDDRFICLEKFESLSQKLDTTDKVKIENTPGPLFCCSFLELHCKKCKSKVGILIVSATPKANEIRDKILLWPDSLELGQRESYNTPQKREYRFLVSEYKDPHEGKITEQNIEEHLDKASKQVERCKEKYSLMISFYKVLDDRLKVIENHNVSLQNVLFGLTRMILGKSKRGIKSTSSSQRKAQFEHERLSDVYKPELNPILETSDDQEKQSERGKKRKLQHVVEDPTGHQLRMQKK